MKAASHRLASRVLVIVPIIVLVALCTVACGNDDADDVTSACRAFCDKQSDAAGCSDLDDYIQVCNALCGVIAAQLDADCRANAQASYRCQSTLSYECAEGGDIPVQTTNGCEAEITAFSSCFGED